MEIIFSLIRCWSGTSIWQITLLFPGPEAGKEDQYSRTLYPRDRVFVGGFGLLASYSYRWLLPCSHACWQKKGRPVGPKPPAQPWLELWISSSPEWKAVVWGSIRWTCTTQRVDWLQFSKPGSSPLVPELQTKRKKDIEISPLTLPELALLLCRDLTKLWATADL